MQCVRCSATIVKQKLHGIEVDACPDGHGMWLDVHELDALEDKGYDEDELKGSLMYRKVDAKERCPHCRAQLIQFQYRFNDLHLEYCPDDHGYWLDSGEDHRIIDLMNQREEAMERKVQAEAEWGRTIDQLRSKSLVTKMDKHLRQRAFWYKWRRRLPW